MKISCDIIRDLLPLYAEELVSQDSKQLVEEHLQDCEGCTRQLGILKKAAALPIEVETKSIQRVGDTIRRKRILAVLTALGLLGTLIFGAALLLDARIYLPADQAVTRVEAMEDGSIRYFMSDAVIGTGSMGNVNLPEESNPRAEISAGNYGVISFTNLWKLWFGSGRTPYEELPLEMQNVIDEKVYGSHRIQLPGGAVNYNIWYVDAKTGIGEKLLWDAGHDYDSAPMTDVNYHIADYVAGMAGLCILFALASRFLKKPWMKEPSVRLAIACGSLSLSTVIVTAGQFMELWGEFTEAVVSGFCLAVPMTLTCIAARQLWLLGQKEKGR